MIRKKSKAEKENHFTSARWFVMDRIESSNYVLNRLVLRKWHASSNRNENAVSAATVMTAFTKPAMAIITSTAKQMNWN